jgi:hypothetical protein
MDCSTARLLLELARPGGTDLDESDAERLEDHLADCPLCREFAAGERCMDEALARAMQAIPLPDGLQGRLEARLQSGFRRLMRRRMVQAAVLTAVAAGVMATAVMAFPREKRPLGIDLEQTYLAISQEPGSSPEQVNEWFEDTYHVRTEAPANFDYRLLVLRNLADFQGRRVPFLLFARGGAYARVYILSGEWFDLEDVPEAPGYRVVFLRDPSDDRIGYVVTYTSDQLDWFLNKGDPQPGDSARTDAQ